MVLPVNIMFALIFKNVRKQEGDFDFMEDQYSKPEDVVRKGNCSLPRWVLIPTWIGEWNYILVLSL